MTRPIMDDTKKIITDYADNLPKHLEQIRMLILEACYHLEKKDYGGVSDKLTSLETLANFLFWDYPIGFRYLDSLIESRQ